MFKLIEEFYFFFLQESGIGLPVTIKVDERGFFLYWMDQKKVKALLPEYYYDLTYIIMTAFIIIICFQRYFFS